MDTLIQALQACARSDKGIHLPGRGGQERFLPYRQLRDDALVLLGDFHRGGVERGDQVILQYADLGELMTAFWACLLGGIVPVPLALADQAGHADKVLAVWRVLDRPWLAHDGKRTLQRLEAFAAGAGLAEQWQAMAGRLLTPGRDGEPGTPAPVQSEDTAFIQFSSGSTGTPKGVVLTHSNLLTNIGDMLDSVHHRPEDVFLSWKPITHDFGMIAFHLAPIVGGSAQVRITTDAFIWNPALWLAAAHRYRATILGSPNFGYRHFLKLYRRGRRRRFDWDLSCVRVILNGAEPIGADLCREFQRELADYGLPPRAITPGYGLAEGSLIVSLCDPDQEIQTLSADRCRLAVGEPLSRPEGSDHGVAFVDCGRPYPHTQVRITDGERRPLGDDRVGHIEIRGPAVTAGYYRNPEATARVLDPEGWLDTEDLGVLHQGRLFVVGRVKEMIVLGGVNYFPHDIERIILRARGENNLNHYIACGVADPERGGEELLIFVYYKGPPEDFRETAAELRQVVGEQLGLPVAHVIPVRRIPKTTSGKVQRFRLVADFLDGAFDGVLEALGERCTLDRGEPVQPVVETPPPSEVEEGVARRVATLLGRPLTEADRKTGFFDLGLTSLKLLTLREQLEGDFRVLLDSSSPLDFPDICTLAREIGRLLGAESAPRNTRTVSTDSREPIAVIGMACRFPGGADSPRAFWELLREGRDPVTELPSGRWRHDPHRETTPTTSQGGYLEGVEQFDPLFFGIAPAEAQSLDPQQRLLLEVCHEALENAGYLPEEFPGCRTGVFIGISCSDYAAVGRHLGHDTGPYTFTGTMFNTAAGRISYTFGFQGPCLAIDTACSSSLVAVQQGIRELQAGSCDRVLAGGVSLLLGSDGHISFSALNALSPSGRCRSFDQAADGYIRSEGCGVVVLKRLSEALRDNDPILGVLRGTAVNHNGHSGGLTVPSGPAQERLIRAALDEADLEPEQVDYLEAHGSGTRLGDPQELNALARVFAERGKPLWLGSVKSNLGHLESAAGVAGLIKVLLILGHRTLVPNLHFTHPNGLFDWQRLPLRVVDRVLSWDSGTDRPRIAGISSFGISGTNAHLILEEAPRRVLPADSDPPGPYVFTLSARSPQGLQATARAFLAADHWQQAPLAALCQTVNRLRSRHPLRFACSVADSANLLKKLERLAEEGPTPAPEPGRVAFLFTGQGSHYPGMARELYRDSRPFREAFDRCAELFRPLLEADLGEVLYGESPPETPSTRLTQALIFTVEYALSELWQALGVRPALVLGHSIGEYAAACRAGVMTLEAAVTMVALRGRLMEEAPADGAMAGILADQATVEALCRDHGVHLAAFNGPENFTVSGERQAVARVVAAARKARVFTEALPMNHAFHSPRMASTARVLARGLAEIEFAAPLIPLISTQSGRPVTRAGEMGRDYWSEHLCQPVRFAQALAVAAQQGVTVFVEIGATATLSGLGAQLLRDESYSFLPSLRQGRNAWAPFNDTLAALWQRGHEIDWSVYHSGRYRFVPDLPNTGYHRTPCWFADLREGRHPEGEHVPMTATAPTPQPVTAETPVATGPREDQVLADIKEMVSRVTGVAPGQIDDQVHLFALGVDSLMLVQLDRQVVARYGVDIPLKTFFTELHTPARIAAHVFNHMEPPAPTAPPIPQEVPTASALSAPAPTPAGAADGVAAVVQAQLEIMRQQLALLGGHPVAAAAPATSPVAVPVPAVTTDPTFRQEQVNRLRDMTLQEEDLDPAQRAFVEDLVRRCNERTPGSKAYAQRHRAGFADWIATLNFSLTTKEMAYPLVAAGSQGSRFRDIDGNDYIDTAIGYGVSFFGHNPAFVTEAIQAQLAEGMALGPQSDLAGEVTELIRELTGVERVAFCNTGTEAVMVALRLARTVTGRRRIVRFITAFHGSFDGVLAEAGEGGAPVPMAPGIPPGMVADTVVLHYGSPESLETIRALGPELAAVLVEPVQSRNPGLQPGEYLRQLRRITAEAGSALIFDEMVTGFRIHTGGAQAHFGVRADLVTYGKIVGGGMPIGVVAGAARYLDAIDGGHWDFGDASGPFQETTFFAGTFCKHPLTLAAARAVLRKLKAEGPALIEAANEMTRRFVEQANALFAAEAVPLRAARFGSLYRFETRPSRDLPRLSLETNLLFRLMLLEGVYVWERRTCFFSTAHSEADAQAILRALGSAVAQLRRGGFSFRALEEGPDSDPHNPGEPQTYPLSSEERRVYVLSRMEGGERAYHVSGALKLIGRLDLERLQAAFETLARRHSLLRTGYRLEGGDIHHRVEERVTVELHRKSGPERPAAARLAGAVSPFDLERAPLWRLTLLETGRDEHILVLDFHHLISDGNSLSILLQEFLDLYQGRELPPVTAGYHRYVVWERDFMAHPEAARQRDYWHRVLTPLPPPLALPLDFPRPPRNDFAGEAVPFTLPEVTLPQVRELARAERVTPFMVLLGAYLAFLHRLCGQDDLCVGTPFDRRAGGPFQGTVGMFAQTLVIRTRAGPELSFADLLARVRETCTEAYDHPDYPLDSLLEELAVPRDFGRNPLFDTLFIFESGNRRVFDIPGLRAETLPMPVDGAAFDLTLELTEERERLHGNLIFARRLLHSETVGRWAGYFGHLLQQVLADPCRPLGELELLDPRERHRLLETFNATGRDYPTTETVHGLFEATAARHPGDPALICAERVLSYRELETASGVLARRLVALGVQPGNRVGVLLERSPALITALLGVLRAGAAYVPLDPAYPPARLEQMLEDSEVPVLIGRPSRVGELAFRGTVLDPDDGSGAPEGPLPGVGPGALAYVIFTSGSTGRPKGVMIEHRSVVNFLHGMAEVLDFTGADRTLGLTTLSFDIFVLEVFLTLSRGAVLVLAGEDEQRDPQALARLLARQRPTVVQMTPSRLQLLLSGREATTVLGGVRALLVGGEAFPIPLLAPLQGVEGLRLFNVYGPTETTVWSTAKELTRAETVTLGRPIANTRLYILSPTGELLPPGAVGALWIGGAGLARGYLGDPQRTEAAFRPDPFRPGERIYRTGDRAAWSPEGELLYHGRADDQVKLRGYRIELTDVEAALGSHPAVESAAVVVREPVPGNAQLVAFYRPAAPTPSDRELREHMARRLPDYMLPAAFVTLETLPLTPNGKIDRRALPRELPPADRQDPSRVDESGAVLPGEDELETLILDLWRQVLGPRPIGPGDSFFDVGGNSFSLVLVHGLLGERHPGLVEVADLFAHPTPRALARHLAARLEGPSQGWPTLPFPEGFFQDPGGQTALGVELVGEGYRQLVGAARTRGVEVTTLALAFYLLYLNKLLKTPVVAVAAELPGEGVKAVTVDFAAVSRLDDVLQRLQQPRPSLDTPAVTGRDPQGLSLLFDGSGGGGLRPGFDLVVGLSAREDGLLLRADHDGRRLNGEKVRYFLANYVRLVKAMIGQNTGQGAAVRLETPAA